MPRLARGWGRVGPTPLIMRTSVVRDRDIDVSFIPLRERWPRKSERPTASWRPAQDAWLTIICPHHPPFFRMCGRERTCGRAILYLWQPKELRARFLYVWQG